MNDLFLEKTIYKLLKNFEYTRNNNMVLYASYCVTKLRNRTDNIERAFYDIFIYPQERKKYGLESYGRVMQTKNKLQEKYPELKFRKEGKNEEDNSNKER